MFRPDASRQGLPPGASASTRLSRHIRSPQTSYHPTTVKVKQTLRVHYPNLSPTRAPSVAADAALWPDWTKLRVEVLPYEEFDDDGNPVRQEGGQS